MNGEIVRRDEAKVSVYDSGFLLGDGMWEGKPYYYQKHMPHHMINGIPSDWIADISNVFLIRHPARVIVSYVKKRENPNASDMGFEDQSALFDEIAASQGKPPVVVDSTDIRANPADMLEKLCDAIGLPFDPAMLSWPAGGQAQDGAWAPHWYPEVWKSTGFAAVESTLPEVPDHLQPLLESALPHCERFATLAINSASARRSIHATPWRKNENSCRRMPHYIPDRLKYRTCRNNTCRRMG